MNTAPDPVAPRSADLFNQGLCGAEGVLQAVAEGRSIRSDLVPQIATGWCAGITRTGGICGAVRGGVLAISLVTGRKHLKASRVENHRLGRQCLNECEARVGSTNCEKPIGCRLDTPEGRQFFKDHNLREKCAGFTSEATRLASRLLSEPSAPPAPPSN